MEQNRNLGKVSVGILGLLIAATAALAAEPPPAPGNGGSEDNRGERLNVQQLKEKYWAKGEENELRVVRNRLYSKAGKVEVGLFVGSISTDPFLSVRNQPLFSRRASKLYLPPVDLASRAV